ncbi:MAG: hypothetical protein ACREAB_04610 [Blastocatellia bacterium]
MKHDYTSEFLRQRLSSIRSDKFQIISIQLDIEKRLGCKEFGPAADPPQNFRAP